MTTSATSSVALFMLAAAVFVVQVAGHLVIDKTGLTGSTTQRRVRY
jgi:hypothetical protein